MKNNISRFAGIAALASGMLFAQVPPASAPNPAQPGQHRQMHRGQGFERLATRLNLTEAQKGQAKSIMQSSREAAKPVAQELRQDRMALREAVKAGDTQQIDRISAKVGTLTGQVTAIRTKAFAKVYAMLTPDQKAQADQMFAHRHGMFRGEHGQAHRNGSGA